MITLAYGALELIWGNSQSFPPHPGHAKIAQKALRSKEATLEGGTTVSAGTAVSPLLNTPKSAVARSRQERLLHRFSELSGLDVMSLMTSPPSVEVKTTTPYAPRRAGMSPHLRGVVDGEGTFFSDRALWHYR